LRHRWQPLALALAVAVALLVCARNAAAQTVIVKGAPAGTPIELALNADVVANATVDAEGLATLRVPARGDAPASTEALVSVDRCATERRVVLTEQGATAIPAGGCVRQSVPGLFVTRGETTFVIDLSGANPSLSIAQGRPPEAWLLAGAAGLEATGFAALPKGLMLFGGGGLTIVRKIDDVACGDVACDAKLARGTLSAGIAYWLTPMFGVEAQFVRPGKATASGSGTNYRFDSELEAQMLSLTGMIAAPAGRARLYARGGVNRHAATLRTTQTVDAGSTTLPDGTTQPTAGGTSTRELRTEGWGWVAGGGVEVWVSGRVAIYGDLANGSLKGEALDIPEGVIDDKPWIATGGVRVRLF
jgi:hypothetical protein